MKSGHQTSLTDFVRSSSGTKATTAGVNGASSGAKPSTVVSNDATFSSAASHFESRITQNPDTSISNGAHSKGVTLTRSANHDKSGDKGKGLPPKNPRADIRVPKSSTKGSNSSSNTTPSPRVSNTGAGPFQVRPVGTTATTSATNEPFQSSRHRAPFISTLVISDSDDDIPLITRPEGGSGSQPVAKRRKPARTASGTDSCVCVCGVGSSFHVLHIFRLAVFNTLQMDWKSLIKRSGVGGMWNGGGIEEEGCTKGVGGRERNVAG